MTQLIDAITRHQVNTQRFAGGQARKALPVLRALARELRERIASGNVTEFQARRIITLEADIREIVGARVSDMQMTLELDEFAQREIEWTTRVLGGYVSVDLSGALQTDFAANVATNAQMVLTASGVRKTLTIQQAFDEFSEAVSRQTMRAVQAGVIEGRTSDQIARQVFTLAQTRTRQQASALTRTVINHIGSQARQEVYNANSDIIQGERYLATLDQKTSVSCASLDQKEFPIGQGPIPPIHFNCRSIRTPIIKPQFRIDTMGERASMNGPVSNRTTYGGWLKGQSEEFQNDVLGPKRASLFRSGQVSIDKFTDSDGRVLSLDELSAREGLEIN